jgi:hypothetical protein
MRDRAHIERLRDVAQDALANLKVTKGPRTRRSLHLLVMELCSLYSQLSGKPITHTRSREPDCPGGPASPAGRFALDALRDIDASVTPTQISTAMGQVMNAPTKRRKPSSK